MLTTLFIIRKVKEMKKETEELIKLISSADDCDRAALTAFAILLDYLSHKEPERKTSSRKEIPSRTYPA
jgi:hypothetical protein